METEGSSEIVGLDVINVKVYSFLSFTMDSTLRIAGAGTGMSVVIDCGSCFTAIKWHAYL